MLSWRKWWPWRGPGCDFIDSRTSPKFACLCLGSVLILLWWSSTSPRADQCSRHHAELHVAPLCIPLHCQSLLPSVTDLQLVLHTFQRWYSSILVYQTWNEIINFWVSWFLTLKDVGIYFILTKKTRFVHNFYLFFTKSLHIKISLFHWWFFWFSKIILRTITSRFWWLYICTFIQGYITVQFIYNSFQSFKFMWA